jgi:DNA-binding MarR family transcriptional regulator
VHCQRFGPRIQSHQPTIRNAVKVLERKELVAKTPSDQDKRAHSLALTKDGRKLVKEAGDFANPMRDIAENLPVREICLGCPEFKAPIK